ncbi:MAG TPA: preprotein translocase subunit SecE [Candidatus Sumerlaeota bacterium]|nr:preprotein translocase subunit SecE [Candidatus Sumerlaeota bacterium]
MGKIIVLVVLALIVLAVLVSLPKLMPKLRSLRKFFDEVALEMTKVTWPTQQEVINSTALVLVVTVILTVVVGFADLIFGRLVRLLF